MNVVLPAFLSLFFIMAVGLSACQHNCTKSYKRIWLKFSDLALILEVIGFWQSFRLVKKKRKKLAALTKRCGL